MNSNFWLARYYCWVRLLTLGLVTGAIAISTVPVTYAQDYLANPNQLGMAGEMPLTPEIISKVITINEFALNVQMTAQERREFADIMARHWHSDGGQLQQTVSQLLPAYDQLMQLPETTRKIARRSTVLTFLLGLDKNAAENDEISILMLRAYRRVHPPLLQQAPFVSAEVADAFIDAYLFINEIKSGQKAPALSEAARAKTRLGIASDFARMPESQRAQFIEQMGRATNLMLTWPKMESWEKLLARAEVGAPLSPQEQQMAQQIRHRLNGHSMQMAINELNFMAQNQQTIMGSAPYWNPSTQAWEQKGGIVTEFR